MAEPLSLREAASELVADLVLVEQTRSNYAAALQMMHELPQLFLGA